MKFIIDFKNTASDADISGYLTENNCTVLKEWDNFDKVFLVETDNLPPSSLIVESVVEEETLELKPLLDYVSVSGELNPHIMCHTDPTKEKITVSTSDPKQWWINYSYIAPQFEVPSYQIARLGHNVDIYLMDSGIEKSHPEFAEANIVDLFSVVPGNFEDTKGHGTALASVMVGKTCGITNATVKNVKIWDKNHTTRQSDFLDALDAIINDHEDGTYSICNCSWSIAKNEWVENKLKILFDEGVSIIAAAGNNGQPIEDVTPASMYEALTVGSYNQDLLPSNFSDYSGNVAHSLTTDSTNWGELDGWAPGENIYVATLGGNYGYSAGTSAAAAISSAILASNLSWFADDNGKIIPYYDENHAQFSTDMKNGVYLFNKPDLLDLSDPKYADSINRVAGIFDKSIQGVTQFPDELNLKVKITGKMSTFGSLFQPNATKKIEWIVPLPENFYALPDGLLAGNPTESQGPQEGEHYKYYQSTYKRTNIDDSVEFCTVNLYVINDTLDPNAIPEDDPITPIVFMTLCFANVPGCTVNTDFCTYGCTGGYACCGITCGKYLLACECVPVCQ